MKIVDQTPLVDKKGQLGIIQRMQGMLQFGFNWPNEIAAQNAIVKFFENQLERGYTLIRNMTLGASGIMIPMILLGPAGIFVIHVTYLRGRYQAKGDSWNVEAGNGYKPAPINLIQRTSRMARALQAYIERQGVNMPVNIESVLVAGDPGLFIESERPAIRVMMIDGIKSFVAGLTTARPVLSAVQVIDLVERILNPRPPKRESVAPPAPGPLAAREQPIQEDVSRARAIFSAAEEPKPFNPADFDFAMTDGEPIPEVPGSTREASTARPNQRSQPQGRRIFGMTVIQLAVVAALGLCFVCILVAAFVYIIPRVS